MTLQIAIPFCETPRTGHSPCGRSICMALALIASSNQWLCPLWQVQIYDSDPYGKFQINGSAFKSIALPLLTRSSLWFWPLWKDQSNGSGACGKIKSMALALIARSKKWIWPLWQHQSNGSGHNGKTKAMDMALSWAWVLNTPAMTWFLLGSSFCRPLESPATEEQIPSQSPYSIRSRDWGFRRVGPHSLARSDSPHKPAWGAHSKMGRYPRVYALVSRLSCLGGSRLPRTDSSCRTYSHSSNPVQRWLSPPIPAALP